MRIGWFFNARAWRLRFSKDARTIAVQVGPLAAVILRRERIVNADTREHLKRRRDLGIATAAELLAHHESRLETIRQRGVDPCAPVPPVVSGESKRDAG